MFKKVFFALLVALFCVVGITAQAQNYLPFTAAGCVTDASGSTLTSGTMTIQATDASNNPIPFRAGGNSQAITAPITKTITAGTVTTFNIANPAFSSPQNIRYRISILDNATKRVTAYNQVAVTDNDGTLTPTFNFCKFDTGVTLPALQVTGPQGIPGPTGVSTANGASGNFNIAGSVTTNATMTCDGVTNATTSFSSSIISGKFTLFPNSNCMVDEGTTKNLTSSVLRGQGPYYASRIIGRGTTGSPVLSIGDGTADLFGVRMENLSMASQGDATTGISMPNGVLHFNRTNLSSLTNVQLSAYGTGSTVLANTPGNLFQEMEFDAVSLYGQSTKHGTFGADLSATNGNLNFNHSNVEALDTGIRTRGAWGGPTLFTFTGGRMERIAWNSFDLDQTQGFVYGADIAAGDFFLGNSSFGGNYRPSVASAGWMSWPIMNGIGDDMVRSSASRLSPAVNAKPDMWLRAGGNVNTDPTFCNSATTAASGWTATNSTLAFNEEMVPGADCGRALQVTPTSAGGYASKTFTVAASSNYLLSVVSYFISTQNSTQIQVYDNTSTLLWDSGTIAAPNAGGTLSSDMVQYMVNRRVIATGSSTTLTIRLIAPTASVPASFPMVLLNKSDMIQTTNTLGGTATCSGSGATFSCNIPGRNNGATGSAITWNLTYQPVPAILHFRATTSVNAVNARMSIHQSGSNAPMMMDMQPGTTREYNIPLPDYADVVSFGDFVSADATNMQISDVAVLPVYKFTGSNQKPITTSTLGVAGQFVKYVDDNGVQQFGTVAPSALEAWQRTDVNMIGNAADQTVMTVTGGTGAGQMSAPGAGLGKRISLSWIRTAGAGSTVVSVRLNGTNVWSCTLQSAATSGFSVLRLDLMNLPGVQNSQWAEAPMVTANTSTNCANVSSGTTVDWSVARDLTIVYNAPTSGDTMTFKTLKVEKIQ